MVTVSVLAHKRGECYTLSTVNQSGFDDDDNEEEEEAANGDAAAAAAGDDDGDAASAAGIRVKFEAYYIYIYYQLHLKLLSTPLKKGCPKCSSGALGDTGVHRHRTNF